MWLLHLPALPLDAICIATARRRLYRYGHNSFHHTSNVPGADSHVQRRIDASAATLKNLMEADFGHITRFVLHICLTIDLR
jgi:hypothetical protein